MFWVGLSVLIMSMTGLGDDTRVFLHFVEQMQLAATEEISAPDRRAEVISAMKDFRKDFYDHRARLGKVGDCIEALDRSYSVTFEQYEACGKGEGDVMGDAANSLVGILNQTNNATTPEERTRMKERMVE
jgi:hypothetical protein